MHIVLAGGGTAGHVEPLLNTADGLRAAMPEVEVTILGTAEGLEQRLVPARGYPLTVIPRVPLPRRPNRDLITLPFRMRRAVSIVAALLERKPAAAVVGFGGFVSLPAYLAARRMGVPVVVHEANARPGLANRIGARFAQVVVETVAGSIPGALPLGLPLRSPIREFDRASARAAGLAEWGLEPGRPTLLVFGGSQGARRLNTVVAAAADGLIKAGWQILHSVGSKNSDQLVDDKSGYRTVTYIDRMEYAYGVADAALCRAGAMTVAELTATGVPAIYVPLPIGNGEQRLNALPVVAAGGGAIIEDSDLTAERLTAQLTQWRESGLTEIAVRAGKCGRPDALDEFVEVIMRVAGGGR